MARRRDEMRVVLDEVIATPMWERGEQDGRLYWRIRTRDAKRRTVAQGWWTLAEAQRECARLVMQGIPSPPSSRGDVRTVGDLMRRWVQAQERRLEARKIAPLSLDVYRRGARYWIGALDDVLVSRLTRTMVEDQITDWQASGVAPRTCQSAVAVLRAAVRWGAERGHVPQPPDLRRLDLRVRDDEYVYTDATPSRVDAAAVLAHIPPGPARDLIAILAYTGCRVGEAAALTVGDVDLRAGLLTISGQDERRGRRGKVKPRHWPISGELADLLQRLTAGRPDPTEPLLELPHNVSGMVRRNLVTACARASVQRYTAHGLRRMVAMELLEVTDPRSVSALTGHTVATLLAHYVRPTAERLRSVVQRAGVAHLEERGTVIQLPGTATGHTDGE